MLILIIIYKFVDKEKNKNLGYTILPEFEKNLLFKSDKKFFEKIKPLDLMKNQKYDQARKFQNDQILIDLSIYESDIESHLIQFDQIRKWEDKIIKYEDKIRQNQLDLQQTINNQRNAVAKLFFGSKEKEILRLQNQIDQYCKSIQNLKGLINITMGQVCLFEIPDFIKEKELIGDGIDKFECRVLVKYFGFSFNILD